MPTKREDNKETLEEKRAYEAYDDLTSIRPEDLEYFAYDEEARGLGTSNLAKRFERYNRVKRILKIAELIRKERESNE